MEELESSDTINIRKLVVLAIEFFHSEVTRNIVQFEKLESIQGKIRLKFFVTYAVVIEPDYFEIGELGKLLERVEFTVAQMHIK